ncbi:MAG: serine/threonine-protein kinase [Planctomycetota bacterium]
MAKPNDDLRTDPLLQSAPTIDGFKVLEPAVLYAKVGAGGMGAVYRGTHFSLECDVAVKVLMPALAQDEAFVKRFEREAKLAAKINHQNVVRVMDVREQNGVHYLVMEFVKGETTRERAQRKGPLKEQEALAIVWGAATGLAEAHGKNIVHSDIKPDNILVSFMGEVKLADLGLAKGKRPQGGESLSMLSSSVMGTPQYLPPEQWRTADVQPSADVWALGAVLYYLVAGSSAIVAGELLAMADQIRAETMRRPVLVQMCRSVVTSAEVVAAVAVEVAEHTPRRSVGPELHRPAIAVVRRRARRGDAMRRGQKAPALAVPPRRRRPRRCTGPSTVAGS